MLVMRVLAFCNTVGCLEVSNFSMGLYGCLGCDLYLD